MPNNSYTAAKALDDYKDFAYFMNTTPEQRAKDREELAEARRSRFIGQPRDETYRRGITFELADKRRKVIEKLFVQGLSVAEIATKCRCSESLVERRIRELRFKYRMGRE